jgi:hypothetical protein
VYLARVAQQMRKIEHVPINEDHIFPSVPPPSSSSSDPPATYEPDRIRGLRELIPAVLEEVKKSIVALGSIRLSPHLIEKRVKVYSDAIQATIYDLRVEKP